LKMTKTKYRPTVLNYVSSKQLLHVECEIIIEQRLVELGA